MIQVKRYLPELIYDKIQTLNYKNKDHLYFICDMITRVASIRRNNNSWNSYIDIPRDYFRDIIKDSSYYYAAINCLLINNIIESDNHYSKNAGKALGFRYNNEYISPLKEVYLVNKSMIENIIDNKNKRNNLVSKELERSRDYFLNNFKIDYVEAKEWIDSWFYYELIKLNDKYNSLLCGRKLNNQYDKEFKELTTTNNYLISQIENINDNNLYFSRNKTNNRIDTNLTNLKGDLKQFITIPNLTQIDISNSQPYILYLTLLKNKCLLCKSKLDQKELDLYGSWVSEGLFYEHFMNYTNNLTRDEVKDLMFCIFYSKNESYLEEKKVFKSIFPTIYECIYEYKKNKHNELAILMQQIESEICINIICQDLDKEDINYFTIHDSWLVDNDKIDQVKDIIEQNFQKKYNNKPHLKIKKITK